jgi:type I restriction enzyme S subunit
MTKYPNAPLGSLVKIVRGISYKSSELSDGDRGVPMVNLRNVGKGGGFRADGLKRYTGEYKPSQVLKPGDLVLANTDLSKAKDVLGSTFLIPPAVSGAVLSLDLSKLVPDESVIDKKFLNFFLHSPIARSFMKAHGQGITVMHLRMSALPNLEVPVPPLGEQRRIVITLDAHLSRIDKALAEFADARASLLLLERAILYGAFSSAAVASELVDFEDFFTVLKPKFEGYKQKDYLTKGKVPIIDQGSALIGGYVNETKRCLVVQKPLVIFGDHTRCVKFVDFDFAMGADGTKLLDPNPNVEAKFAYWQLRGKELRNRGYARHMGELRKERFWRPDNLTQNEAIQRVEQAFESLQQIRNQLETQEKAVEVMRRSLLHVAFSGNMKGLN